jgi:S1 RNA binding domain
VVVDASFGHRIDPSEVRAFDQAVEHGEMITPPAGAIGRGDGFILRIAEKSGALVLSNDSFQEFHAERPWLFEPGRLIGGKPVPGVGWIFTPRTPVRGARSRSVTSRSKREGRAADVERDVVSENGIDPSEVVEVPRGGRRAKGSGATSAQKVGVASDPDTDSASPSIKPAKAAKAAKAKKAAKSESPAKAAKATKKTTKAEKAAKATKATKVDGSAKAAKATKKATKAEKATKTNKAAKAAKGAGPTGGSEPIKATKASAKKASKAAAGKTPPEEQDGTGGGGSRTAGSSEALNDPMTFLTFVADHPVGSVFDGTVVSFTSHGAHVDVGGMLTHVPLRGLGRPAPHKARQVLAKGETRPFRLVSLDAGRRRAELALPDIDS